MVLREGVGRTEVERGRERTSLGLSSPDITVTSERGNVAAAEDVPVPSTSGVSLGITAVEDGATPTESCEVFSSCGVVRKLMVLTPEYVVVAVADISDVSLLEKTGVAVMESVEVASGISVLFVTEEGLVANSGMAEENSILAIIEGSEVVWNDVII